MSEQHASPSFRDAPPPIFAKSTRESLERLRRDKERTTGLLRTMLEHLEHVLFGPSLSVQTWKRACGIRDNSIAIHFHKTLGVPPRAYIERLRIEVAEKLLRDSDLRIWQIADLLGYSSLGVFSKAFGRCTGLRPKEFRRRAQVGDPSSITFSSVELEKAIRGDLDEASIQQLIRKILERYPDLTVEWLPESATDSGSQRDSATDPRAEPERVASSSNQSL